MRGLAAAVLAFHALLAALGCGARGDATPESRPAFRGPIVMISLSAFPAGAMDGTRRTPGLDHLLADATWSGRGVASASWSTASFASVMTGLPPSIHGATHPARPRLRPDVPTLAQELSAAGFTTRGFYASPWSGPGSGLERGFESTRPARRRAAERFLATLPAGPSFTWIEIPLPGSAFAVAGEGEEENGDEVDGEEDISSSRFTEADRRLRRVLEAIERGGHEADAIVVVLADHGEGSSDGSPVPPGLAIDRASVEVPLAIRLPETLGARIEIPRGATVGLDRIYATLLELAGIEPLPSAAPSLLRPSAWVGLSELWFAGGRHEIGLYEDGHQLRWRCAFAPADPDFERAWRAALGPEGGLAYGEGMKRFEETFRALPGCAAGEELVLEAWPERGGVTAVDDAGRRERMAERLRNLRHFPPPSSLGPAPPPPALRRRDFFSLAGWGLPLPRQWGAFGDPATGTE